MGSLSQSLVSIQADVASFKILVRGLQNQLSSEAVKLQGVSFTSSRAFTKGWLLANVTDPTGFMFFVDVHSLLAVGSSGLMASHEEGWIWRRTQSKQAILVHRKPR